jgi:hypothetical protein
MSFVGAEAVRNISTAISNPITPKDPSSWLRTAKAQREVLDRVGSTGSVSFSGLKQNQQQREKTSERARLLALRREGFYPKRFTWVHSEVFTPGICQTSSP